MSDVQIRKPYNVVIKDVDADIYEAFKKVVGSKRVGDASREVFEIAMIRFIRERKGEITKKRGMRS